MERVGTGDSGRPTVRQMMLRDVFLFTASSPFILLTMILVQRTIELENGSEPTDMTIWYLLLLADTLFSVFLVQWRWRMYSSLLLTGVEVPGEITAITGSGDTLKVEYSYRWQAETVRSTSAMGGYIPKTKLKHQVGMRVRLLVDPNRPKKFLVLDTIV